MEETYPERVARIQHDQNVSEREAIRVARTEIMLEERQKIKAIQEGVASGILIRTGPGKVEPKEKN